MAFDDKIRCSECGYELVGLSGAGDCPECGNSFDLDSNQGIVRRSATMEAHERGDRVLFHIKLWGFVLLAVVCMAWGGWASIDSTMPKRPLTIGALFAGLFGFGAVVTWFTEKD